MRLHEGTLTVKAKCQLRHPALLNNHLQILIVLSPVKLELQCLDYVHTVRMISAGLSIEILGGMLGNAIDFSVFFLFVSFLIPPFSFPFPF